MRHLLALVLFISTTVYGQSSNKLHFKSVLVDAHNDILSSAMLDGVDISDRVKVGHSDLPRWKEGGLDVQFFSVWTGEKARTHQGFYNDAIQEISMLDTLVNKNPGKIILARNFKDVRNGIRQGKLVALVGVEGGHMIEDDLNKLLELYNRGMRYLTLTWNNSTSWASSAMDETKSSFSFSDRDMKANDVTTKGLSALGKDIVRKMNELGIIVDLSHTGEQTFYDAIATTRKPVLLSHSSVWALCPVFRNVKDEQIKAVAKNRGVICINFYSGFISRKWEEKQKYLQASRKDIIQYKWSALDSVSQVKAWRSFYDSTLDANRPTINELVDHIDYIKKLVGVKYVGIGSDYDGVSSLPVGMDDVTKYPLITEELMRRGYSKSSIKRILGRNVLRVMRANFN